MNIAIDMSPLETSHSARGVGVYTKNLIEALQKYEGAHSYTLFTRKQKVPKNADIVHYPYFDPFFLTLPFIKEHPTVVTVHDLIPFVFPDKFKSGMRGALKWNMQKISLKSAKRIITDSNASKRDIARIVGVKTSNIDVVYLAPDVVFSPKKTKPTKKKYFLYVGDVNWNKNVPGLLQAFAKISTGTLVLVGAAFTNTSLAETKEINKLIGALGIESSVVRAGHVSNEKLASLYSGAAALVQPSYYEGFGLPVLEAMVCGCPVVCANTSSLTEIAGPAILVDTDPESLKRGMMDALHVDRAAQQRKQFDWVKRFTWKRVANETIKVYEKVLENA